MHEMSKSIFWKKKKKKSKCCLQKFLPNMQCIEFNMLMVKYLCMMCEFVAVM